MHSGADDYGESDRGLSDRAISWDRLDNEPSLWYERFTIYRLLGPERNLVAAHAEAKVVEGRPGSPESKPGQAWHRNSRTWRWLARATAWDDAERDRLCAEEEHRRIDARLARLEAIEEQRSSASRALLAANLDGLSQDEAREMLSTLRLLFKDAVQMERLEYGEATEIVEGSGPTVGEDVASMIEKVYGNAKSA